MLRWISLLLLSLVIVGAGAAQSFDANDVKIHYTSVGHGEPVVLVHGFAASSVANWGLPGIVKDLARDYRVIAIDNRGHGQSGKPHDPSRYGIEMVDDVVRLLDHLGIDKAHVVGYSMGAFITHKLCMRHPQRLLSATLGGAGWMQPDDPLTRAVIAELTAALDSGKGVTPLLRRLAPAGTTEPMEMIAARSTLIMAVNDPKALSAVMKSLLALAVTEEELKTNKVPLQVLIGARDPLKVGVDRMKEKRPELRVIEIDGADHISTLHRPEFRSSLREFLVAYRQAQVESEAERRSRSAARLAEDFATAVLRRDLKAVMKMADVPWCHDGLEIIRDPARVEENFRKSFARDRDFSKFKVVVRESLPLEGFAARGKKAPERKVSLADVLDKEGRIVHLELVHDKGAEPLWIAVRLDQAEAKVVGFFD
jgi:pimeloyl-ACP methyl ester carboxylesterase